MFKKVEYIGQVTDNKDPEMKGGCKVRVPVLHWGISDEELPFIYPDVSFTSFIPEIGDKVYCYYTDSFHENGFYKGAIGFGDSNEDAYFEENVKNEVGSESDYPNMKFLKFKNGVLIGVDSSEDTPEVVIFHPKGSYFFINKDGLFDIKTSEKSLKGLFSDLFNKVLNLKTTGSPTNHTLAPDSITDFQVNLPEELDKIFL